MKISDATTASIALPPSTASAATAKNVEPRRTSVTRSDLKGAITRALTKLDGTVPAAALVDTLTAHASLETASGASMYNYNFGGIKGQSPKGSTAIIKTHEVLNGKDVVIKDGFRAYDSLDEGAVDYVKTIRSRFGGALASASQGDAAGFAHALKSAGYYTASEADYARGISNLMNAHTTSTATSSALTIASKSAPMTTMSLGRVETFLDADRFVLSAPHARKQAEGEDDND